MFDVKNGNTNRKDSDLLEIKQIYNLNPFDYLGSVNSAPISPRHKKIQVHPIFNYKHDETYKAQMVASGNMTVPNLDSYYSRVISISSMCIVVFLALLNMIERHTGDISTAYLTARIT